MDKLLIIDKCGEMTVTRATLAEAARILDLEADHIEWAIEEFGRCDEGYRIVIKEEYNPNE